MGTHYQRTLNYEYYYYSILRGDGGREMGALLNLLGIHPIRNVTTFYVGTSAVKDKNLHRL